MTAKSSQPRCEEDKIIGHIDYLFGVRGVVPYDSGLRLIEDVLTHARNNISGRLFG
jgi:hypothetical protein